MRGLPLRSQVACVLVSLASSVALAQDKPITHYYFPEGDECTAVLDFQSRRGDLEKSSVEKKTLVLANELLRDFSLNGSEKCQGAKRIHLLAVFIPGVDNYGRPDFPGRVNLLRLDGTIDQMTNGMKREYRDVSELKAAFTVTGY